MPPIHQICPNIHYVATGRPIVAMHDVMATMANEATISDLSPKERRSQPIEPDPDAFLLSIGRVTSSGEMQAASELVMYCARHAFELGSLMPILVVTEVGVDISSLHPFILSWARRKLREGDCADDIAQAVLDRSRLYSAARAMRGCAS